MFDLFLRGATASELGQYGITVNAYAPGAVETTLSGYIPPFLLEENIT